MNWAISIAAVISIIYLAIMAGMYTYQRKLLYLPEHLNHGPADVSLIGVEEVTVTTRDGENLQSWYLPAQTGKPTILFFHGNGGSIVGRADRLAFYQARGFGALLVSYRGYGKSTGSPTEAGLVSDALATYDWLRAKNLPANNIVVVGESLGAAVAVRLTVQRPIKALVIEAPFTSTMDVAKSVYWWLPIDLLMKDRFETIKIIDQVKVPMLIIHGDKDEITNVKQGRKLFEKANQPKSLKVIADTDHNGLFVQSTWRIEIDFIKALKAVPATEQDPA